MRHPMQRLAEDLDDVSHPWLTPATRRAWRSLRSRHRPAIIAGLLAALAVLVAANLVTTLTARTEVFVAVRDLPAGHRVTSVDLMSVTLPGNAVPATAITDLSAISGVLADAMATHEVLTRTRIVQPLTEGGLLVPVRLPDAAVAALLRPGDVIDVLAASPDLGGTKPAEMVAASVTVATVPEPSDSGMSATSGAVIVVSADEETAARLAGAAATATLSVALHP